MGYYTHHSLDIIGFQPTPHDHEQAIGELSEYGYMTFEDSIKWYDHEEHMRKYSKLHPAIVFELSGEGEESGDLWREYYSDGKMQRCKATIIYADFDESKLT